MSVNTETPKKKPSVLISFSVIILLVALLGLVIAAGGNIIPVLVSGGNRSVLRLHLERTDRRHGGKMHRSD